MNTPNEARRCADCFMSLITSWNQDGFATTTLGEMEQLARRGDRRAQGQMWAVKELFEAVWPRVVRTEKAVADYHRLQTLAVQAGELPPDLERLELWRSMYFADGSGMHVWQAAGGRVFVSVTSA